MRPLLFVLLVALAGCRSSSTTTVASTPTPASTATADDAPTPPPIATKIYDLSTPAKRAEAVKEAAGLTAIGECVQEIAEFPGVVLVGYQGHNGCVPRGYFAGGAYVEQRESARSAFGAAWGNASNRDALARTWLDKAMRVQLQTKDGGASAPAAIAPDGSLVFEGYDPLPLPHGAGFYNRVRVTVSPDARITVEALERGLEASQLR